MEGKKKTYRRGFTMSEYTPWVKGMLGHDLPCTAAAEVSDYLNSPDVRRNLHVPETVHPWEMCSWNITYTR